MLSLCTALRLLQGKTHALDHYSLTDNGQLDKHLVLSHSISLCYWGLRAIRTIISVSIISLIVTLRTNIEVWTLPVVVHSC